MFGMPLLKRFTVLLTLACALSHAQLAIAAYPEKPLRLIAPFAPGGGTDQMSRALGAGLSKVLGQTVVIENKPGAGTVIGMDLVARSAPDGASRISKGTWCEESGRRAHETRPRGAAAEAP